MPDNYTLREIFKNNKPVIGMVHLRPLPGSPLYNPIEMDIKKITEIAVDDAKKLQSGGVDGIQIENTWDYPYLKGSEIGHETTASMTAIALKVKESVNIPIGINLHLNGGMQAISIANAIGAKWVRVFEWINAYISHAGILEGISGKLSRYRNFIHAKDIKFFCDVNVKHGSHFIISDRSIAEQARDAETEGAEALIVTGFETGVAPTQNQVEDFTKSISIPVFVGSGTTKDNVGNLMKYVDGAIVGSYFKEENNWKKQVDEKRVKEFMSVVERLRKEL